MSKSLSNEQIARCIDIVRGMAAQRSEPGIGNAVLLDGDLIYESRIEAAVAGEVGTSTRIERVYFRDLEEASIGITEFETHAAGTRGERTTKFTLEGHFDKLDECSQRLMLYLADRGCQV